MAAKVFRFSIVNMRSNTTGAFAAESATLEGAFKAGAGSLPAVFADKQTGLRMFRIRFENTKTGEFSAFIGQGDDVAAAFADGMKNARETFRPKNDGRPRPAIGLTVLLPPRAGDVHAIGRAVSRSIESFQSDETYAQEEARKVREAERARLQALGIRIA